MPSEKRVYERRNLRIPMVYWKEENNKPVGVGTEVISKDVSVNGVSFESKTIYFLGATFIAEILLPSSPEAIVTKLKVVRIESVLGREKKFLIGLIFIDIKPEDKNTIAASMKKMNLYTMLKKAREASASDLHLTVGRPPILRIEGKIQPMDIEPIKDGETMAMLYPLINIAQIETFEKNKELDFAFSPDINSRFRVNLHLQRGFLEATLRSIPANIRTFIELGLQPRSMEKMCREKAGLLLIAGTTGSGKTTTVASMVDYINKTREGVIITIEDPIEYAIASKKSIIKQRELGSDTLSYAEALRRTLRQDPDVVVVGELLDSECVLAALQAAETGHLVISTIHASDTIHAIERIINFFPPEHSTTIRQQFSSCLLGILFQILLTGKENTRVLATECLINTTAITNLIREGRYDQVHTIIQTGRAQGMYTLQSRIDELYGKALVDGRVLEQIRSKR